MWVFLKNYLDSYDDPFVWESPRLIVQIDSLMNLVLKNCDVTADDEAFELHYDMIAPFRIGKPVVTL